MKTIRSAFALATLAAAGSVPAHAAAYIGAADCRVAELTPAAAATLRWDGACKDGYADGKGRLQWSDKGKYLIEATLVRGDISGEAKLTTREWVYTGTLRNGLPHGQGYFEYADHGGWYEGAIVDGKPEGAGIYLAADRSKYTGYWKNGKRHGFGEETFSLGGSYKGQWQDDVFHGPGTIVYAGSGRKYTGNFQDGRVAGLAAPEIDTKRYVMNDAIARVGSHLPQERASDMVPPAASWEKLTEAQKNRIRSQYATLEHGDDPPYPLYGTRELYQTVMRLTEKLDGIHGKAAVLVTVGADGKPKHASVYATSNPDLAKFVSTTMMVQKYKPARCQGQPCEMGYIVDLDYSIRD